MAFPFSIEIRHGQSSDQTSIADFDEFGGDRQREIAAGCLFVATHCRVVVGYVSYEPRGLLGQPLLTYLCVHKDHRRKGIATSLVKQVRSVARGRKLISSTEDWCIGTQQIFERLGWARIGSIAQVNKDGSNEFFYAIAIDALPVFSSGPPTSGAMSALLRPAKPEDAREIMRVLRASRLCFLPHAPPAHSELEDLHWVSHSLIPSGGVTVACFEGAVVGVLAVSHSDGVSWIDQMYIAPECCGRGIGTRLLRAALGSLAMPIRLYTFQENQRARAFYERFGFAPVAFSDGSHNEEGCPDVLYQLVKSDD